MRWASSSAWMPRALRLGPVEPVPKDGAGGDLTSLLRFQWYACLVSARSKRTGKPCRGAAMPNGHARFMWQEYGAAHAGGPRAAAGGQIGNTGTFRGKPKRNGRACGRQYLRSAICVTRSKP